MKPQVSEVFAALVGLDWADAHHDVCLQAAGTAPRELLRLEQSPEAMNAWVQTLRTRCHGQPIAVCLELKKGPSPSLLAATRSPFHRPGPWEPGPPPMALGSRLSNTGTTQRLARRRPGRA